MSRLQKKIESNRRDFTNDPRKLLSTRHKYSIRPYLLTLIQRELRLSLWEIRSNIKGNELEFF